MKTQRSIVLSCLGLFLSLQACGPIVINFPDWRADGGVDAGPGPGPGPGQQPPTLPAPGVDAGFYDAGLYPECVLPPPPEPVDAGPDPVCYAGCDADSECGTGQICYIPPPPECLNDPVSPCVTHPPCFSPCGCNTGTNCSPPAICKSGYCVDHVNEIDGGAPSDAGFKPPPEPVPAPVDAGLDSVCYAGCDVDSECGMGQICYVPPPPECLNDPVSPCVTHPPCFDACGCNTDPNVVCTAVCKSGYCVDSYMDAGAAP